MSVRVHADRSCSRRGAGAVRAGRRQRSHGARPVHGRAPDQHIRPRSRGWRSRPGGSSGGDDGQHASRTQVARQRWLACSGAVIVVGVSGAIAALGDTLFPSTTLGEALAADLSPTSHILLRLRMLHPALRDRHGTRTGRGRAAAGTQERLAVGARAWHGAWPALALMQLVVGVLNVMLLAPVWMQLVHLLVADVLWIVLVLLGAVLLRRPAARVSPIKAAVARRGRAGRSAARSGEGVAGLHVAGLQPALEPLHALRRRSVREALRTDAPGRLPLERSSPIAEAARRPSSTSPGSMMPRCALEWPQTPAKQSACSSMRTDSWFA